MDEEAPAWAYERAELHPHDPRWADRAATERDSLQELLNPWLVDGIEHIGSTAVPGLSAKPIIDLMASVTDLDTVVATASDLLAAAGWAYVPKELDNRPWRRFFVKPEARRPPAPDPGRPPEVDRPDPLPRRTEKRQRTSAGLRRPETPTSSTKRPRP